MNLHSTERKRTNKAGINYYSEIIQVRNTKSTNIPCLPNFPIASEISVLTIDFN